jgi:hypothetical protein
MANVFCSSKLKEFLKPLIAINKTIENNEQWNAHLFYLEGKKCIIFLNKETIYSFVLFEILKKDISNIRRLFIDGFINKLYEDDILELKDELVLRMKYENISFLMINNDKSAIGSINDCISRITFSPVDNKCSLKEAKNYVKKNLNDTPMGAVKYQFPIKLMKEKIKNNQYS